jgi:hypothetical protein
LTTTAGDLGLRIPKLRAGSFFPALLERRRRVDQALFAVVMEAYVHGAPPERSMISSKHSVRTPGYLSPKYPASARAWMRKSPSFVTVRLRARTSPTCSLTRPTAKPGSGTASCPKRSLSLSVLRPMGVASREVV